jgi:2-dehydro-3-deoxyphosphooctonate aldolase (KDO 8-P synthase)
MSTELKAQSHITLDQIHMGNDQPFVLFGGMNVLESKDLAFEIAETYIDITKRLGIPYVFKASFDKANRSSLHSYRGPGLEKGLQWLDELKAKYNVPVITDIMSPFRLNLLHKLPILFSCLLF